MTTHNYKPGDKVLIEATITDVEPGGMFVNIGEHHGSVPVRSSLWVNGKYVQPHPDTETPLETVTHKPEPIVLPSVLRYFDGQASERNLATLATVAKAVEHLAKSLGRDVEYR